MNGQSPSEPPRKTLLIEQFKSLVSDVGNIGTRYATANGFYLSILTALTGLLAYVGTGKPLERTTYPVILLVTVFAVAICWIWRKTISFYGKLFASKFAVLNELERELPVQVYAREADELYTKRGAERLTDHEAKVPFFLGAFFCVVGIVAVVLFAASFQ
jgi:hypothetical protein